MRGRRRMGVRRKRRIWRRGDRMRKKKRAERGEDG